MCIVTAFGNCNRGVLKVRARVDRLQYFIIFALQEQTAVGTPNIGDVKDPETVTKLQRDENPDLKVKMFILFCLSQKMLFSFWFVTKTVCSIQKAPEDWLERFV